MARVILVLMLILSSFTEGVAQCTCTNCGCSDSLELVKLYNSTDGANWTNKWVLTQPIATWYKVTLVNGRVTELGLYANGLKARFPILICSISSTLTLVLTN